MLILLVNLDRSPERLRCMSERLAALGLSYRRVPAVDGHSLSQEEIGAVLARRPRMAPLSAGEVACFMSHRQCWRQIAAGADSHGAVFEDDVELSPRLPGFLGETGWIPAGADLVKLETFGDKVWLDRPGHRLQGGFALARLRSRHWGCAGYIVSREGAARLLRLTERFSDPADDVMFNPACGIAGRLVTWQILPALCIQSSHLHPAGADGFFASTLEAQRRPSMFVNLKGAAKVRRELAHPVRKLWHRLHGRWRTRVAFDAPDGPHLPWENGIGRVDDIGAST